MHNESVVIEIGTKVASGGGGGTGGEETGRSERTL